MPADLREAVPGRIRSAAVERRDAGTGLPRNPGSRLGLGLAGVMLAATVTLLAAAPAHAASEGDLRLRGGASLSHHEGRLEIYHSGEWGTVCDDYFQLQEAEVACMQMGFTGAQELVRGWRGPSSRPIWLDDVDCDGTESGLSECSSRGWGVHNCSHSEDVGMRCTAATTAVGVLIGKRKLRIDEQDVTGAKYSVTLGKVPSGNVTVTVAGHAGTDLTVTNASLTFTTSNWSTAQDVTVTAGNDSDTTQDTATLTHSASGGGYGSVTIPSVAVVVNDNDDKGVTVSPQSMTIFEKVLPELSYLQKPNDTYSVVLTGEPSADVTVTITATPVTNDITLSDSGGTSISSLTFTTSNWSTPQTVTATAAYDDDTNDEAPVTLTHTPAGGGYNNVSFPDVTVRVDDIYSKGVGVNQVPLTVREGASVGRDFTVVLKGPPTGRVTIAFAPPGGENLSFDPSQLVFTKNDWRPAKRVHVRQGNDGDAEHERVEIGLSATGGGYGSVTIPPVEVLLIDDDNGGLPGSPRNLRATPGQGSVGLKWEPPLEDPEKPVLNYEYQQEGESSWTPTSGPETSKDVTGLANGESYQFRLRAVNAEGKGAASEPSDPVTPAPSGPTAEFQSVPASHDGSSRFTLRLDFSEEVSVGFRTMRDDALEVTGGTVTRARRAERGSNAGWMITIEPETDGTVAVTLPVRACDETGAVCTSDGEALAEGVTASVPGPAMPAVSIAADTSPVTEGTAAAFTLTRTGDATAALTVGLGVREDGAVLSGTAPAEAVFAAGAATVALDVATEDDEVVEAASVVTVTLASGTGYTLDASASAASVTVEDDDAAPALSAASADGATLTLGFDEALDGGSVPAAAAFSVTVDGTSRSVDAVSVSGSEVALTLASAVAAGEVVTVNYTVPTGADASPLQDPAGNAAAGFADEAVTNDTAAANAAPTGLPTIAGAARVGETLTASASGIGDADGLANATFAWQWIASDGNSDTDIADATAETYTLTSAEVGKTVKVRATFTDDGGTEETLVSAASVEVEEPLTARISSLPASHDGSTSFSFELRFSEEVSLGAQALREDVLQVTGGSLSGAAMLDPASTAAWTVTLTPSTDDWVTVRLWTRESCSHTGAICTAGGKPLASQLVETVQGPVGVAAPVVVQAGAGTPVAVPADWSLKPPDIAEGEQFRLIFVTSGRNSADSGNIADYDALIQRHAGSGHPDIQDHRSRFKVLGSTQTVAARDHTGSNPRTDRGGPGVPIYWLNGPRAADDYRDFYDDGWDHFNPGRDEAGTAVYFSSSDTVWTGTQHGGQSYASGHLGHATNVKVGRPYINQPISRGFVVKSDDGNAGRMYGLSPVFEVAVSTTAEPVVSIAGGAPITEGAAAAFTLSRTGDTTDTLAVSLNVTEAGSVLAGSPAATVTFAAGSAEATLAVATDDDGAAEADSRVTATVAAGSGYAVAAEAASASVDVYDNDAASVSVAETLWTATLTVQDFGGALLGHVIGNSLTPDSWSEDGAQFRVSSLHYFVQDEELTFTLSAGVTEPEQLTLHLDDLKVQLSGVSGERFFLWTVDHPGWQAGQSVAVKLTRADPTTATDAGPGISVADAQVQEAEGAALAFQVTLAAAANSVVSVRYATADNTATAGTDYIARTGVLRFEAGETARTVAVTVLNDVVDEGSETLTLTLSRPFGGTLADGTATGTIMNAGPMPRAWITRFGRTVALQAVDAIGDRLDGSGNTAGAHVVVGGMELGGAGRLDGTLAGTDAAWSPGPAGLGESRRAGESYAVSSRELLLGSSFRLGAGGEDGGPAWTAWGRFAAAGFEGADGGLTLAGDVITGFLGADVAAERWLAGLALGVSEGEGSFGHGAGRGSAESSLTSVFPYARLGVGDRVDLWGLVGAGRGDLRFVVGEEATETDLAMGMGALGLRAELMPVAPARAGGLALKFDALWVRTESDAARSSTGGNLAAASGDVSRLRLGLEGSWAFAAGAGATVTPTLELGLRHDGGDAETGTGVEAGFGLRYAAPAQGLTVEGRVRGLLTHAAGGYEEWGARGSVLFDPGASGRGLSLTIAPAWGAASGGVERLWSVAPGRGLAPDGAFRAEAGLRAELGYGLRPPVGHHGALTPYAGFAMAGAGAGHAYRIGARWAAEPAFGLALEASHGEADGDAEPDTALTLRGTYRW